ncbi:hypothetical protein HJC10_03405 [Corallococcus exiguus]|nr:hypothetical protein [Corallococcus exiguus]
MDDIDKLHANEERRATLRAAVKARLAEIEAELPALIKEVSSLQAHERYYEEIEQSSNSWDEMRRKTALRDALVAEHTVLEGLLDRPVARWVPRVALGVGVVSLLWNIALTLNR